MSDGFYGSTAWFKLRSTARARWQRAGLPCAYCSEPLEWLQRGSVVVDHIKNRKQFPHLALVLSNLCVVHHACNSRKYHHLEANTREAVGIDGFPEAWR